MAPESRRVLDLARQEMLALSHWWIGTEHLLWGLASEDSLTSFLTPRGLRLSVFMRHRVYLRPPGATRPIGPRLSTTCRRLIRCTQVAYSSRQTGDRPGRRRDEEPGRAKHTPDTSSAWLDERRRGHWRGSAALAGRQSFAGAHRTAFLPLPIRSALSADVSAPRCSRFFPAEVGIA